MAVDSRALLAVRLAPVSRLGFGELLAVLQPAERHLDGLLDALAHDHHVDRLADRAFGDDARQVAHLVDVLAVELDDDVAGLDRAVVDRAALDDAGHQRALGLRHAEALGDLVGDRLDAHAEPAAPRLAEFASWLDDADGQLRGIEKPMPIEPPDGEMIAVLMPTTSPCMLNSGPPELPRLIAASVWMKSS